MAALQPAGGLPFSKKSFTDVLTSSTLPSAPVASATQLSSDLSHAPNAASKLGSHKGFPTIFIPDSQWSNLANSFKWTLVGKFSQGFNKQQPELGRPSVDKLQEYFGSLDLKGEFSIGLLDNRHLLIQLALEEDYLRIYYRMIWYIGNVTMRIFKWSPDFHVDKESPIVPVWITMPRLPVHLFAKPILCQIASLIGLPLHLDAATVSLKRPSVARIQVEIDLLKPCPNQVWIGIGERGSFWQKIEYENVPPYCEHCWHVGHAGQFCRIHHPELKTQPPKANNNVKGKQVQRTVYVAKNQSMDAPSTSAINLDSSLPPPIVSPPVAPVPGPTSGNTATTDPPMDPQQALQVPQLISQAPQPAPQLPLVDEVAELNPTSNNVQASKHL